MGRRTTKVRPHQRLDKFDPSRDPSVMQASTGAYQGPREVDMNQDLELVEATLKEMRALIREGHELLRDLRVESRQARRILPMIVTTRIRKEVEKQLGELAAATDQAMRDNVKRITASFDKMSAVLLGEDPKSKKEGRRSLPELIGLVAEVEEATQQVHAGLERIAE